MIHIKKKILKKNDDLRIKTGAGKGGGMQSRKKFNGNEWDSWLFRGSNWLYPHLRGDLGLLVFLTKSTKFHPTRSDSVFWWVTRLHFSAWCSNSEATSQPIISSKSGRTFEQPSAVMACLEDTLISAGSMERGGHFSYCLVECLGWKVTQSSFFYPVWKLSSLTI